MAGTQTNETRRSRSEILERGIELFNDGRIEEVADLYHPDADLSISPVYAPAGTVYHGREGIRTLLGEVLPRLGAVRMEARELRETNDAVVAFVTVTVDGGAREEIFVYTFRECLITRLDQFDTEAEAMECAERPGLFTRRERQIFEMLARGMSGPEIADELVLSPETVRTHVQNGVERLGARTRVHAVAMAIDSGEISL